MGISNSDLIVSPWPKCLIQVVKGFCCCCEAPGVQPQAMAFVQRKVFAKI